MLYTLLKFLGWGILLALVGGCVGWMLRSLKCRGEVAQARATTVDPDEVERMRHRLANLEQVVAERDRLRMQVADMRHADSPGVVGAALADVDGAGDEPDADTAAGDTATGGSEAGDTGEETADDAPSIVPDAGDTTGDVSADAAATPAGFAAVASDADDAGDDDDGDDAGEAEPEPVALDLDAAADAIGKKIKLDDLTVVEGIGPKIAELCNGIGITTWQGLADTEVPALQSMLDAAGSRYQIHNPGSWPRQAGLLASGQWAEFKQLTDELDGGV